MRLADMRARRSQRVRPTQAARLRPHGHTEPCLLLAHENVAVTSVFGTWRHLLAGTGGLFSPHGWMERKDMDQSTALH